MSVYDITNRPEVGETAGLVNGIAYHGERLSQEGGVDSVSWKEPGLKVTRLRLLSDPGFPAWDVSYCHGILDGRHVDVELPFSQLAKYRTTISKQIVAYAKRDGVYAKRLGILDAISKLN